jgi:hypothetical protein
MLPSTSFADDKNEEMHDRLESKCKKEMESPKTACEEFDLKFKPTLNREGTLLFKDLYLRGNYGFTNTTGTTGILGQFSMPAAIEKTQKYGIGIGYRDKPIVSNIMAFFPQQNPGKHTWEKDLVLDPIKLTAEVSLGKALKTSFDPVKGKDEDHYPVKTYYNVDISYCLPIDTFMYYLGKSTGITCFRDRK